MDIREEEAACARLPFELGNGFASAWHLELQQPPDLSHHPNARKMASSIPLQIAETIQTASIKRSPSPRHDLNPSTTASQKQPVKLTSPPSESSLDKYAYDGIDDDEAEDEDIPYSVLNPVPRRNDFGPLPDLRFEQSYLASIAGAETWSRVLFITVRDQVRTSTYLPHLHS